MCKGIKVLSVMIFTAFTMVLFACDDLPSVKVQLERIEINEASVPGAIDLNVFSLEAIELILFYSNNTSETIPLDISMVRALDLEKLSTPGHHTITIVYEMNTVSFQVTLLEPIVYQMQFETFGGTEVPAILAFAAVPIVAPMDPEKEGHTFMGWYLHGEPYSFSTMPAEDITLEALWEVNTYTLSFDSAGGSAVAAITQAFGQPLVAPDLPVKEGHTFEGWYVDSELYVFTTMPAIDLTLVAGWSVNAYTITFDSAEGSDVDAITQTFGSIVTPPDPPVREGFTFLGWWLDGEPYDFTTMPARHLTLVAHWTAYPIISFDSAGGSPVEMISLEPGTPLIAPPIPEKLHYVFMGWLLEGEPYTLTVMPEESLTLVARWEPKQYTIHFDSAGGSPIAGLVGPFNSPVEAPIAPTKEGHTFIAWEFNGMVYTFTTMPAEDITVSAIWEVNQYTIRFDSAGGSEVAEITDDFGVLVSAPAIPHKEGHTFVTWQLEGEVYSFTTMPASDIVLTAVWSLNQYTITFDSASGSFIEAITQDYGSPIVMQEIPTKLGYTFIGWEPQLPETMPASDMTLTAQYAVNTYTVTFIDYDESVLKTQLIEHGSDATPPVAPNNQEGWTFLEWDTDFTQVTEPLTVKAIYSINLYGLHYYAEDGMTIIQSTVYAFGADLSGHLPPEAPEKIGYTFEGWEALPSHMPASDLSYVASYTINDYTVTFDTEGGTEIPPMTYTYQAPMEAPEEPTKLGYVFVGWFEDQARIKAFVFETMPAHHLTLYAKWEKVEDPLVNHFYLRVTEQTDTHVTIEVVLGGIVYVNMYDARIYYDASLLTVESHLNYLSNIINASNPGEILFNFIDIFDAIQSDTVILSITFSLVEYESTTIDIQVIQAAKLDDVYMPVVVETHTTGITIVWD